jgi:signal transduction histidine kinase
MRSLRNRLALLFGLIVLGAIGIVYFSITPLLADRLTAQRLDRLLLDAQRARPSVIRPVAKRQPVDIVEARTRALATRTGSEALIIALRGRAQPRPRTLADSNPAGIRDQDVGRLVRSAIAGRGRGAQGVVATDFGRMAVGVAPLREGKRVIGAVVLADSLDEVEDNVALIRRQVLYSGGIALAIAITGGYLVALRLSRRVKRLERAARRVADGDFGEPIASDSQDELGQLAAAFDEMQGQLAQLDTARKQFIASASHELRTPLFSLGGFLELLADEDLDEPTRKQFIAQVRDQVERLRRLTVELLDLSRLESGALELRPEPTDLGQLARDVAGEFTPAFARHGSPFALEVGREALELECDPERVAQIIRILLDNALVHTPEGTPIAVSAARRDGHVRVEVSDAGLGIRRQSMPHIFDPFYTADDGAQGAGLGLAIARELADHMRGNLTVRSIPGRTTFTLALPS